MQLDEPDDIGVREKDGELAHLRGERARRVHGQYLRVPLDDPSEVHPGEQIPHQPQLLHQKVGFEVQHPGKPAHQDAHVDVLDVHRPPQRVLELDDPLDEALGVAVEPPGERRLDEILSLRRALHPVGAPELVQLRHLLVRQGDTPAGHDLRLVVHVQSVRRDVVECVALVVGMVEFGVARGFSGRRFSRGRDGTPLVSLALHHPTVRAGRGFPRGARAQPDEAVRSLAVGSPGGPSRNSTTGRHTPADQGGFRSATRSGYEAPRRARASRLKHRAAFLP
mmetsp:Transcript_2500/g.9389  ORF Transcript_2500/g.9389 Transcript_2500/m.9389 type:complete len:280 (+) Transcript_2500:692-1531(+)